jgi:16S rRNA processing protein RimM
VPDGLKQMSTRRIVMGVVTGAHGVRGLVRVKSFTADAADLTAYGPLTDAQGAKTYDLTPKGMVKGQVLAAIAGCADRTAAEALRGTELYLDRDLLPDADEEEFYHADLVGLDVVDTDGALVGTVRGVFDFGSGDMLDVVRPDGGSELFEFSQEVVPEIDLDAGRLTVVRPEELVEDRNGEVKR